MIAILLTQQTEVVFNAADMLLRLGMAILIGGLAAYFHYFPPKKRGGGRLPGFIIGVPLALLLSFMLIEVAWSLPDTPGADPLHPVILDGDNHLPVSLVIRQWALSITVVTAGMAIGGLVGAPIFRRRKNRQASMPARP